MIRYCNRCVMPDTRPDLLIDDEGVCNSCRAYEFRNQIDWDQRREAFMKLVDRYRSKDGSNYDCIVPVSGGKDSHFQTLKLLEYGLNPLAVMATTDRLSEIGRRNLENLKRLGVDCIEIDVNPVVRRKINRIALSQVGDISWPEHVTIFTVPVRLAVQIGVPLIVWGENTENEYGGPDRAANEYRLINRSWLEEFGGMLGLRVSDLIGVDDIRRWDVIQYTYPPDDVVEAAGIIGIYLGYFFPWDGYSNALLAQGYGFETYSTPVEGSIVNYENLDNLQTGIHDYFMYLKYGFGRATMQACLHIRRGRISRGQALEMVRLRDGQFPWTYLGHPIEKLLDEIGLTIDEFQRICDQFTNKKLFRVDNNNTLLRDARGDLIKVNYDNEV